MEINEMLLTDGNSRPRTKLGAVKGIIIHYVGNTGSTAKNNRDFFNNPKENTGKASSHYIVGLQGEVIRCIPDDEVANHAGKSYGSQWDGIVKENNKTLLSIETCHPKADGKFADATYNSLVELTSELCKKYNLDPLTQVYRHYDRSGKSCPLYYVNNPSAWEGLRQDIDKRYWGQLPQETPSVKNDVPQWQKDSFRQAVDKGMINTPEYWESRLSEPMTIGEMFSVLAKL